ncbi:hypothetical protein AVEN_64732-1 [Araneus ventricosus]|uniref:THAP-type domain-containing protein n=1 Tax=Araneus ventricosus TaxID=182803 RepID=A0A4Y2PER3_ARAVE|nr:hypothetical protein AVEN_64732-1 [Araneus ventricosus]
MPNTCCVTNCRGNYDAENKVAVFSFSKVEELKLKCIHAIPRRDLVVTKNTKVCEKHFTDDDIERVSTFYKESTGETLIAKLKKPRLKEGATPKIFPHCPSYLSSTMVARDGPEVRKLNLEEQHLHKAIADSLLTKEQYDNKFSFQNFVEMHNCFSINEVPPFWSRIHKDNHVIFLSLVISECVPCITYAITLNDDLQLNISYKGQNLSKRKDTKLPIKFEGEENAVKTASFSILRKIYDIESSELLKFGIELTRKALWPTNLERQNVSLALKIFSSNLVKGLLELGEKHNLMHYGDTLKFLNIFCTWWDIANVKTVTKGKHKNNPMAEPITDSLNDIKKEFLKKFIAWLDKYEKMNSSNCRFSRETHSALSQTSQAFLSVTEYCCNNLNMYYLLLGKIQTDKLESRFGQYRSMSGDQYHISIRQLYETENKLRISRELKLISHTSGSFDIDLFDNSDQDENSVEIIDDFFQDIEISNSDIDKVADSLPVIAYLAGYCSHSAHKNVKCYKCRKKLLTDKEMDVDNFKLIKSCDRGGLLYPSKFVTNIVLHISIVTQKLISEKYELQFLKVQNQRNLVKKLVEKLLMSKDVWDFSVCSCGYIFEKVIAKIMKSATNTLRNNYCKIKNDKPKCSKTKKKQKLESLSESKNTSSLLEKKTKTKKIVISFTDRMFILYFIIILICFASAILVF